MKSIYARIIMINFLKNMNKIELVCHKYVIFKTDIILFPSKHVNPIFIFKSNI